SGRKAAHARATAARSRAYARPASTAGTTSTPAAGSRRVSGSLESSRSRIVRTRTACPRAACPAASATTTSSRPPACAGAATWRIESGRPAATPVSSRSGTTLTTRTPAARRTAAAAASRQQLVAEAREHRPGHPGHQLQLLARQPRDALAVHVPDRLVLLVHRPRAPRIHHPGTIPTQPQEVQHPLQLAPRVPRQVLVAHPDDPLQVLRILEQYLV